MFRKTSADVESDPEEIRVSQLGGAARDDLRREDHRRSVDD